MNSLAQEPDFETANLAFVGYRDFYNKDDNYVVKNFTSNISEMRDFIASVETISNDDYAEDVVGGYYNALKYLSWTPKNHKLIVHFADLPVMVMDGTLELAINTLTR
ncbi:hypothetical protein HK098_004429, partial [Nowakowskiella sp. JEL0407]